MPKTNPKLAPCTFVMNLSFSVLLMKEVPCFQSLQSRRFEARRGLAEARLLAGGSLGFRIVLCCFSSSQIAVWVFFVICVCLVDVCHTNLMGDTMSSFFLIRFNSVACLCLCRVLWGFCCGFCVLCVFGCCFCFCWFSFALHVDSSMDYVSIPFSSPFDAHCRHDDVATALIRCLCKMHLAFRLDKRPGKSHMALDGKKSARPGRGHASDAKRIGTRTKRGLWGLETT